MLGQLALRFAIGGVVVALFSTVGEGFKPKTFAGIFGAAPSVALGSLLLLSLQEGGDRTASEGYAMAWGGVAMVAYSVILSLIVARLRWKAWLEAIAEWSVWLAVAFAAWGAFVRA